MTTADDRPAPAPQKGAGMRAPRINVNAVGFALSPGDPGYQEELERIEARRRELEAQRRDTEGNPT